MGITTAEIAKPKVTIDHPVPALNPKNGGKIRFPAPKKSEKSAKAVTSVPLLDLITKRKLAGKDKIIMTLNFKGEKLFYTDEGEGRVCVLLHGFIENHKIWFPVVNTLKKQYRFISLDLPGHGKSAIFKDVATMLHYAVKVKKLLEALHIDKALFIGHSMGGYVGLAFAKAFPNCTTGLLMLNSTPAPDSDERKQNRRHGIAVAKKNYPAIIKMSVANLFTEAYTKEHQLEITQAQNEALKTPIEGYITAQTAMMERPDSTDFWINAPFKKMMILGVNDMLIDAMETKKHFEKTDIQIVTLQGGHNSLLENTTGVLKATNTFLE